LVVSRALIVVAIDCPEEPACEVALSVSYLVEFPFAAGTVLTGCAGEMFPGACVEIADAGESPEVIVSVPLTNWKL